MDGTTRIAIHTTNLAGPTAITLDYSTQTLYWADNQLGRIESSNVDGSGRRLLVSNIGITYGIDFFRGNLYFTSSGIRSFSVISVNPTQISYGVSTCGTEYDIKVISEERQMHG